LKWDNSPAILTFQDEQSREEIKSMPDMPLMREFQLSFRVGPSGEMSPRPVITTRRDLGVIISFNYQTGILTTKGKGV
jgi:hypothetical protein